MATEVSLRYTGGNSDKVYQVRLVERGGGFAVDFAYGRYGSTLKPGTKTATPVAQAKAQQVFDKLVDEKLREGYQHQNGSATVFSNGGEARTKSGILPQLLTKITEERLEELFASPRWAMQEKKDGERRLIRAERRAATGINKKGEVVALAAEICDAVNRLDMDFTLDCEQIGTTLYVFDILELDGENLRDRSFQDRYHTLLGVMAANGSPRLQVVPAYFKESDKRVAFDAIRFERLEGVVFKDVTAVYQAGRMTTQLKYKFTETATVRVAEVNGRRSVKMAMRDGTDVGSVTIPANHVIPHKGDLCEVRYLYAYPGGALFQTTYLGPRPDQTEADEYDSLKFKARRADEDDDS